MGFSGLVKSLSGKGKKETTPQKTKPEWTITSEETKIICSYLDKIKNISLNITLDDQIIRWEAESINEAGESHKDKDEIKNDFNPKIELLDTIVDVSGKYTGLRPDYKQFLDKLGLSEEEINRYYNRPVIFVTSKDPLSKSHLINLKPLLLAPRHKKGIFKDKHIYSSVETFDRKDLSGNYLNGLLTKYIKSVLIVDTCGKGLKDFDYVNNKARTSNFFVAFIVKEALPSTKNVIYIQSHLLTTANEREGVGECLLNGLENFYKQN